MKREPRKKSQWQGGRQCVFLSVMTAGEIRKGLDMLNVEPDGTGFFQLKGED